MKPQACECFQSEVEGAVTAVYIHPSVARKGIGSDMYAALEAHAAGEAIESLGCRVARNAVPFYEIQGYERVTTHGCEYQDDIDITLVEMGKNLRR